MKKQDYIVITGASSGVGKSCVELLVSRGYRVIPCVRQVEDAKRLEERYNETVYPVIVDLQYQQAISSAAESIARISGDNGIKGLVNCAGTIFSGPIEHFPRDLWFKQYDVNLIGTMAFTTSIIPLLRKMEGRIVNIGAVGGGIALPFFGAIASAKIAFEAANDCLRRELYPWGIHVIIIEPGGINTPANDKMRDSVADYLKSTDQVGIQKYRHAMESFTKWAYEKHLKNLAPSQVADTVLKALSARRPRTRYRRGWDSWGVVLAKWLLPDRLLDQIIMRIASLPPGFGKAIKKG